MARDFDFSELSPAETLDLAVGVEEEARRRYLEFVDQMTLHHTEEAAEFFRKMADLERSHRERLHDLREARFGTGPGVSEPPRQLLEVEAPEYGEVRAFMTVHRALDVALEAERKAERFYDDALEQVEDDELRSLFESLKNQEQRHQELIEKFRRTLPEEDTAVPEDYVDEPRAQ
jgi:rubrerythrin